MEETIIAPPLIAEEVKPVITENLKKDEFHDIPIECFKDFNVPIEGITALEVSQLKEIINWAKEISPDGYMKVIDDLKRQLGTPTINERAYERVWRYVKMQRIINGVRM